MRNSERKLYEQETEIRPNRYVALALTILSFFIIAMLLINELGIFRVSQERMRLCSFAALVILIVPLFTAGTDAGLKSEKTKYLMIGSASIVVAIMCTVLSLHATLILLLPVFLAAQYPSSGLGKIAMICSALCAVVSPEICYFTGMWDVDFAAWQSSVAGFDTIAAKSGMMSTSQAALEIFVYISIPHTLILMSFFPLSGAIAHSGELRLKNQIQVLHMSESDSLTGLLNRMSFDRMLEEGTDTQEGKVCVVYVDANNLHRLNIEKGHVEGDRMLCCVANSLRKAYDDESVYRTGGDEFIAVLYGMQLTEVTGRIETARAEVERNGYSIAVGMEYAELPCTLPAIVNAAEAKMMMDKERYHIVR